MADENEQQTACKAGRDEQHCKCKQRREAAAAAEAASAAANTTAPASTTPTTPKATPFRPSCILDSSKTWPR